MTHSSLNLKSQEEQHLIISKTFLNRMNGLKGFMKARPLLSICTSAVVSCSAYAYNVELIETGKQSSLQLPRNYNKEDIERYWRLRPISVISRVSTIVFEVLPLISSYFIDFKYSSVSEEPAKQIELQERHAKELRLALTRLGPAFIKFGQQLSIRPDLLPSIVLKELQKLCDAVEPVEDEIAFETIRQDLGEEKFSRLKNVKLVASASLGQVYQATLGNETVAIKVQRPDMLSRVSLDIFLLNNYGLFLDTIFNILTNQIPFHVNFIDCFARGSYDELDYENEAKNQMFFKIEFEKRKSKVKIPYVVNDMTAKRVITMEWVEGVKLADASQDQIQKLIPIGVELFLTQLLDLGRFHSDPHPGNLQVTPDGKLCLIDFGLCAEIDQKSRNAMTTAIVHLLSGDFDSLISRDAKELGFLPDSLDVSELKPILTKILNEGLLESGSNLHNRKRKLMSISNELNEVFFKYPFSVPPFFALITRGLGLLEGIALSGDPDFDIFKASLPYATKRAAEIYGSQTMLWFRRRIT